MAFLAATHVPIYSASVLERATTVCILLVQDTGSPQIKNTYPVVDLLVSVFPAKSASIHPCRYIGFLPSYVIS